MDHSGVLSDARDVDPLIGVVLEGRYQVGPRIARGGMAMVYQGTDLRLERPVAIKVMHAGLGEDEEFVYRFQREARSAARLSHPHVVAVFDQGDDHGTLFLVMEHVPGVTLRDVIRAESPMPPARALALVAPVLSALGAAHAAGMIHRDVKPENVLISSDGGVKVADFGLARAVNAETQHTAAGGVLIGTVSYLSPELVVAGTADARADVYAAGVLVYELLTGQKPHQANNAIQVAYKHVHEDIPAPSAAVPGIPAYVDALVARATARDTALRPPDAQVMLHQVRRVQHALEHGVVEDAELTADLRPALTRSHTGELERGDLPEAIIDPSTTHVFDEAPEPTDHTGRIPLPARVGVEDRRPGGAVAVPPGRRRRGPLALVLVLLLAVLAGVAGWYLGFARYTSTPGVIGLSRVEASDRFRQAGLSLELDRRSYSETVPRGAVLGSSPAPGERVPKDGAVAVVVSLGPERHDVPAVTGGTLDEGQQRLDEANLAFGDLVRRFSETVPAGTVITSDPAPGTSLRRDAAVDLVVSRGPRPVDVPNLSGTDAAEAEKRLDELGFSVETSREYDDTVSEGDVVSQSPDSGTAVKGDSVTLVVSRGPELVEVPNVRRQGLAAAIAELEGAGFHVETRRSEVYLGLQYVLRQSPVGGDLAAPGTTIVLELV